MALIKLDLTQFSHSSVPYYTILPRAFVDQLAYTVHGREYVQYTYMQKMMKLAQIGEYVELDEDGWATPLEDQ